MLRTRELALTLTRALHYLSVADVPQPEIQLRPAAPLYEGDRVVATCRADANPPTVQYRYAGPSLDAML